MVQDYFTYAKVFALIIIISTGFYMLSIGKTANFNWHGTETDVTVIGKLFHAKVTDSKLATARNARCGLLS